MAYGDHTSNVNKPNKGLEEGACNRTRCQAEPALYYNHGSQSWYCLDCKVDIGDDPVNRLNWKKDFPHKNHPMFETRQEMTERLAQNTTE